MQKQNFVHPDFHLRMHIMCLESELLKQGQVRTLTCYLAELEIMDSQIKCCVKCQNEQEKQKKKTKTSWYFQELKFTFLKRITLQMKHCKEYMKNYVFVKKYFTLSSLKKIITIILELVKEVNHISNSM